ncbi:hypothetical protein [Pseudovibrio sp. Alg231-02]|uniref:hypothetical protein n=1 Tax=Pseudovibrio sp. Alg231-02 TaxID=1922223 RepID=UPI000D5527B6|nr:hypothetical protein [Pseudovibrio sp. Alg231-02]
MSSKVHMHEVAHHLQKTAINNDDAYRDAFARSAYNRYYYGIFLTVRTMFQSMNTKWSELPHAAYPEILTGQIEKTLKSELKKAQKNGDGQLVKDITRTKHSIRKLKGIIVSANSLRVVADYQPDEPVDFINSDRYSLRKTEITEAHSWKEQTNALCQDILETWSQIYV